jgi:hypothetical protein
MTQMSLGESLRMIEAEIAAGRAESALAQCQETQTQYPLSVQRARRDVPEPAQAA